MSRETRAASFAGVVSHREDPTSGTVAIWFLGEPNWAGDADVVETRGARLVVRGRVVAREPDDPLDVLRVERDIG